MNKKFVIRNYKGEEKEITITNYEKVDYIFYEKISGDQILTITYKDGKEIEFDSSDNRYLSFYDDSEIFKPNKLTQEMLNKLYKGDKKNERN